MSDYMYLKTNWINKLLEIWPEMKEECCVPWSELKMKFTPN